MKTIFRTNDAPLLKRTVLTMLALGAMALCCAATLRSESDGAADNTPDNAINANAPVETAPESHDDSTAADSLPVGTDASDEANAEALGTAPRSGLPGRTVESYRPSGSFDALDDLGIPAGQTSTEELVRSFEGDEASEPEKAEDDAGFERLAPTETPDDSELTAAETLWGRFAPGSWIRTRTVGTTFQTGRNIKSVTETKLTLVEIQPDGYLLKREVSIKMGVRTHTKSPEFIKYNFYGQPFDETARIEQLEPENLSIGRRVVPCRVRRFERITPQGREESTVWYSSVIMPYIFQRMTRGFSPATDELNQGRLISQSQTTIPRSTLNFRVGGEPANWRSQTVEKKTDTVSLTKTVHSNRIPGGVLRETTVESDKNGKILYQSVTVLLDYYEK